MLLLVTVLALGAIVGLSTFRNQIVQEFGDLADGLESLDQSFSVTIEDAEGNAIREIVFDEDNPPPADVPDFNVPPTGESSGGGAPAGISIQEPATGEN